jgi:predicted DNA-binding antitoxin AbrB/MazE fold protein
MVIPLANKTRQIGKSIRARVRSGTLELLDQIDLPEGKEMEIVIRNVVTDLDFDAFERAAGSWNGTVDAEKLIQDVYSDRVISTRPVPHL